MMCLGPQKGWGRAAPLPAGIRVDVSVSCLGGQPGEELREDPLLVSLEK